MPITTKVREDGGVVITVDGPFVIDEVVEANLHVNQEIHAHHLVPYEIWDLSKSDVSEVHIDGDVPAGKKVEGTNPDTTVIIIANDSLKFGLSRMWQTLVGDEFYETRIFRSLPEADAWLSESTG